MELRPVTSGLNLDKIDSGLPQHRTQSAETPSASAAYKLATDNIAEIVSSLLAKAAKQINEQQALLQTLPPQIQAAVRQALQTTLPDAEALSAGLAHLLSRRRAAIDELQKLADSLDLATIFKSVQDQGNLQASARLYQQLAAKILTQLTYSQPDQNVLQQAGKQLQEALSPQLQDAANLPAAASLAKREALLTPTIREATAKLAMPETGTVRSLADADAALLYDKPAEILKQSGQTMQDQGSPQASARFYQQLAAKILTQLTNSPDQSMLQQAGKQLQEALSLLLRDAANLPAAASLAKREAVLPLVIREAAAKLPMPEIGKVWILADADADVVLLYDNPAEIHEQSGQTKQEQGNLQASARLYQQLAAKILTQLTNSPDQSMQQPAGKQLQAALSPQLSDAANLPAAASLAKREAVLPLVIREAAAKLPMPEIGKVWILVDADADVVLLYDNPAEIHEQSSQTKQEQGSLQASARLYQQLAAKILTQLTNSLDQSFLQQAGKQLHDALSQELRDAANLPAAASLAKRESLLPPAIREAAAKLAMPEIGKVWILADADADAVLLYDEPAEILEQSAQTVRRLAESLGRFFNTTSEEVGQSLLFTLQIPYNASAAQPQPLHIHIYHDRQQSADGDKQLRDTWVRISLQPEYTGPVEAVFHLYGDLLDIKVIFADKNASQQFSEQLPQIREACLALPFILTDFSVTSSGE